MTLKAFQHESQTRSLSYTNLTGAICDIARKKYDVQLIRTSNIKWSEINEMFQGALDSFSLYMNHEHFSFDMKASVIKNATIRFNKMLTDLEAQNYKENDPFGALQEARIQMLSPFNSINSKISSVLQLQ